MKYGKAYEFHDFTKVQMVILENCWDEDVNKLEK